MSRTRSQIRAELELIRAMQVYFEVEFDLYPLALRYNHNHGPDGKFCSGSGTSNTGGVIQQSVIDKSGESDIIGLGAGSVGYQPEPHDPPKFIKKIDINNNAAVERELKDFETNAVGKDYETACVITKSGEVYHCFGVKNEVYPDIDLQDKLRGAIVSHNHVKSETEYSFSNADLELFEKYELQTLRGCDHKFRYEVSRIFSNVDSEPEDWNTFENYRHSLVIEFASSRGYGYRRTKI